VAVRVEAGCSWGCWLNVRVAADARTQMLKEGTQYAVVEAGVPLVAAVTRMGQCPEGDDPTAAAPPLSTEHWVVEVTAHATHDTYAAACAAMGAFCDRPAIKALVALRKPVLPLEHLLPPPVVTPPPSVHV